MICNSIAWFVCLQSAEQRRYRLANLEVDGPIFDLDDYVVVELAIERMEIVVGGLGAVVLQVGPVEMMVVDEGAIEHIRRHAALMRAQ